jgi:hypothetical protein
VSAPGYRAVVKKISLDEAARESLPITLEVDPSGSGQPPAGTGATPADSAGSGEKSSVLPTLGWIGVGTGAAALAAGGVFGFMAIGAKGDLVCPNNVCSSDSDVAKLDEAKSQALISTILFAAGGVLATTGVTLLIIDGGSAPTEAKVSAAVLPGGAALVGRF